MLIDSFSENWLAALDQFGVGADEAKTDLLIDGVFIPGFHRSIAAALGYGEDVHFLFSDLPGFDDETRDVSPFLVRYSTSNDR